MPPGLEGSGTLPNREGTAPCDSIWAELFLLPPRSPLSGLLLWFTLDAAPVPCATQAAWPPLGQGQSLCPVPCPPVPLPDPWLTLGWDQLSPCSLAMAGFAFPVSSAHLSHACPHPVPVSPCWPGPCPASYPRVLAGSRLSCRVLSELRLGSLVPGRVKPQMCPQGRVWGHTGCKPAGERRELFWELLHFLLHN